MKMFLLRTADGGVINRVLYPAHGGSDARDRALDTIRSMRDAWVANAPHIVGHLTIDEAVVR